ncbi:Cupredoxin [Penicillium bovifimosum]|uniref:Cupredoxin n=1 Tax=Penicillium bovifimosum TaxID=126998 RepID=A0A9W9HD49_9EURO|nr:Cupredoxin [Penicillium bovifimosum]KAJ5143318.1 Cupredoxin [Penicillium bovifimosum]
MHFSRRHPIFPSHPVQSFDFIGGISHKLTDSQPLRIMFASQLVRPLLAWLALASITAAASSIPSPPSRTSSASAATHTVKVGYKSDPHQFSPAEVKANVGDIILFEFYPTNHSVVKADYLAPCVPASDGLFASGAFEEFYLDDDGQAVGPPPTWSIKINDTETSSQTWRAQYAKALTYPYMLVPGQSPPPEGDGNGSSGGGGDDSSHESQGKSSGLSKGAIAGIAVAGVVFVAILVALFFVLGRNRVYRQWMSSEDGRTERTARWAFFNHGEPNSYTKSEVGSNAPAPMKAAHSDITAVSSPDPTVRTFTPSMEINSGLSSPSAQQGHWSWNDNPHQTRSSAPIVPMELEGHPIGWEVPGSTPPHRY